MTHIGAIGRIAKLGVGTLLMVLGVTAVQAGTINLYGNKAAFLTATGAASVSGLIPNTGYQGTGAVSLPNSAAVPRVTFDSLSGSVYFGTAGLNQAQFAAGQWSSLIPGNDIAISGPESMAVSLTLSASAFALGFDFHEPGFDRTTVVTDTCNIPGGGNDCIDSTFTLTLYSSGSSIGSTTFNATDDVLAFVGIHTDMAFDRLDIVETTGGAENEYFGQFYAGTTAVPEPATLAILGLGLAGIGFGRRNRS